MNGFVDRSDDIIRQIDASINKALVAMGYVAVQLIHNSMDTGYGTPIYDTGNLHRSIQYGEPDGTSITVGTNVEYAPFVHDGTYKMVARPFMRDALQNGLARQAMQETALEYLKR